MGIRAADVLNKIASYKFKTIQDIQKNFETPLDCN